MSFNAAKEECIIRSILEIEFRERPRTISEQIERILEEAGKMGKCKGGKKK